MAKGNANSKPSSGKRAFEEMSDRIRDLIFDRKLRPGDKLPPERELAEMFNASRTVVRESLRVLEHSGLVTIKLGSDGGPFVKEVDTSGISKSMVDVIRRSDLTVKDFVEFRIGVERLGIGSAIARITDDELNALKTSIEEAEALLEKAVSGGPLPDLISWVPALAKFHTLIGRSTGNPFFELIEEVFGTVLKTFLNNAPLVPENFHGHIRDHKAIYEAIEKRDIRLAERLLEDHGLWVGKTLSFGNIRPEKNE
jgi:GntR family transcriptional regulator, transcriptional repressor for pyruvate dehydrogenase complex